MHVIILEPLSSGVALVQAARRSGFDVIVFTARQGEREFAEPADDRGVSVITVDTYDTEAVVAAARELHKEVELLAVIPGWEYCVDVAAETARRLGLPHLSEATAAAARNKFESRERLKAAGLNVPRYALVRTLADAESRAEEVGFPAVFKPTDGGGSVLVRRVDSLPELRKAFEDSSAGMLDVDHFVGRSFLLEEFLDGPEFSIEGYLDRGEPHVVAVTEKRLGTAPFFAEMGHIVEAALSGDERGALVSYIENVARAIGLSIGAFHAEARLTYRGPILIEINCRLGGDRIIRLVELAKGVSLPAAMVRSYCAIDIPEQSISLGARHGIAGVRFLSAPEGATMGEVQGLKEIRAMPGCEEVEIYLRPGDTVQPLTDFRGRVGHVLFTAENRLALDVRLREAETRLQSLIAASFE